MNINGVPITTCSDETLRDELTLMLGGMGMIDVFTQAYAIERELERRSGASTPEQEKPTMADAAEMLWVVLANVSGGDWSKQTPDWQEYAGRWRDYYFAAMKLAASPSPPETQEPKLSAFRELLTKFQAGTHPRAGNAVARAEIQGVQGTLAVVLAEFDKMFAAPLAPPETCAWRDEGWERVTGCGHRSSMLPSDPTRASIGWKGCPYCLRPLSLSSGGTPKGESK